VSQVIGQSRSTPRTGWKFMSRGLLVSRDESQVIGTFRAPRTNSPKQRADIQRVIAAAQDVRYALSRLIELHQTDDEGKPMLRWFDEEQIAERVTAAKRALEAKP
jgi:ferritin